MATNQTTTLTNSNVTLGTLDSYIQIQRPNNFVELKSGGIQVVSSATKHVKIPRLVNDLDDDDVLFSAVGGTMLTHHIKPASNNVSNLGTSSQKFSNLNGVDISGLAVSLTDSITSTSGATSVQNDKDSYVKLPGGVIIQWGSVSQGSSNGLKTVAFPTSFPNSISSAVCSTLRSSDGSNGYNHVSNVDRNGMSILLDGIGGFWIAIGH